MDTKINYTVVGFFVFTLVVLMSGFLFWMAKFGFEEKKFDNYKIEMRGSVGGLNKNAPVKFRGVYVGYVDKIYINRDNSEVIDLDIIIDEGTPIKEDSVAVLAAQGITGLSYIELKGGSNNSKRLAPNSVIHAGKSMLDKIESSAEDISASLLETLRRVDRVLSSENLESFSSLLKNLNSATKGVDSLVNGSSKESIEKLLENANKISQMINDQSIKFEAIVTNGIVAEKDFIKTINHYDELVLTIQKEIDSGAFDVKSISEEYKASFDSLLDEVKRLSYESTNLVKELQSSPSDLLFKSESVKLGPGETL